MLIRVFRKELLMKRHNLLQLITLIFLITAAPCYALEINCYLRAPLLFTNTDDIKENESKYDSRNI